MEAQKNSTLNFRGPTKKLFNSIRRRKKAVTILSLIQRGADIYAKDSKGYTPLLLACKYGLKTVVNQLIECGAVVDGSECPFKRTLLHYASEHGWTEAVQSFGTRLLFMVDRDCSVPCEESTFPDIHAKDMDGRTALHLASCCGHQGVVKCLLDKGADLLTLNKYGETALHEATGEGHLEVVRFLSEKGANLAAKDMDGRTALHLASFCGHLGIVKFLLEKGVNLDARDKYNKTALHVASAEGHLEVVKLLVGKGSDLNASDEYGDTALHKASIEGHLEVVKYLLGEGADMEVNGRGTPLMKAVKSLYCKRICNISFSVDVTVLLINSGANVDCCDEFKRTILHYSSQIGWIEMVQYFVKRIPVPPFTFDRGSIVRSEESACLTIHARDIDGRTALHEASFFGRLDIVKFLVKEGAELDLKDNDGQTALYEASIVGHLETVKYLVEEGADMNKENFKGVTPLLVAARNSREHVVDLLMNSGAILDGCDERKYTVLHYAAKKGWTQIVKSLVSRIFDLNARNNRGETALFSACRSELLQCAECLLKAGARWDIQNKDGYLPINLYNLHCNKVLFFKLFIEAGAYLMPVDYYTIVNNFRLKISLLQDVKLCCQAIVNKYNAHDLPALYKLPVSASLPHIEKMIISSNSKVAQTIEQTVKLEIQTNGYCNVLEVRPLVLSLFSVRSVLEYYDKKTSVLQKQLKRLAASDSKNEYQHLSKSMRLS